jgi:hypothetical protein
LVRRSDWIVGDDNYRRECKYASASDASLALPTSEAARRRGGVFPQFNESFEEV